MLVVNDFINLFPKEVTIFLYFNLPFLILEGFHRQIRTSSSHRLSCQTFRITQSGTRPSVLHPCRSCRGSSCKPQTASRREVAKCKNVVHGNPERRIFNPIPASSPSKTPLLRLSVFRCAGCGGMVRDLHAPDEAHSGRGCRLDGLTAWPFSLIELGGRMPILAQPVRAVN